MSAHCNSSLTSQDVAAKGLVGFVLVRFSSQFVSASSKKLALARILRSPNWSVGHIEAFLTQHRLCELLRRRRSVRDVATVDTQRMVKLRSVSSFVSQSNSMPKFGAFSDCTAHLCKHFRFGTQSLWCLPSEPYKGGSFVTSQWRLSLPAQAFGPVKGRSKHI